MSAISFLKSSAERISVWKLITLSRASASYEGLRKLGVYSRSVDSRCTSSQIASLFNMAADGFYCSTSGTHFTDKEEYLAHMKSDFHRYNLKRKVSLDNNADFPWMYFTSAPTKANCLSRQVAGLPPVTKEWFEARKAQLAGATTSTDTGSKVWIDPLTKKKFSSENTYLAHTRSKKYQVCFGGTLVHSMALSTTCMIAWTLSCLMDRAGLGQEEWQSHASAHGHHEV